MADELRVWTDGADTYVATDIGHAMRLQAEHLGENPQEDPGGWKERLDDPITVYEDTEVGGRCEPVTRSRAEWIALTGPGFLCSTEY